MDLDETWQMGLRPEKTKPCTFTAKSRDGFRRQRGDPLFTVQKVTLFVTRLRVTGNVQRRLDCFYPRVDIP